VQCFVLKKYPRIFWDGHADHVHVYVSVVNADEVCRCPASLLLDLSPADDLPPMSSEALLAPSLGDRAEFDSWLHAPDKEADSQVAPLAPILTGWGSHSRGI
jgi:hypothetical protein